MGRAGQPPADRRGGGAQAIAAPGEHLAARLQPSRAKTIVRPFSIGRDVPEVAAVPHVTCEPPRDPIHPARMHQPRDAASASLAIDHAAQRGAEVSSARLRRSRIGERTSAPDPRRDVSRRGVAAGARDRQQHDGDRADTNTDATQRRTAAPCGILSRHETLLRESRAAPTGSAAASRRASAASARPGRPPTTAR